MTKTIPTELMKQIDGFMESNDGVMLKKNWQEIKKKMLDDYLKR